MPSIIEQIEEITGLSNLSDEEALEILGLRNFKKKKLVNNALDILEEEYEDTETDGDGLFAYIDDFLDDYSDLKSPFKWKEIKRQDIIGLTEYIVDENLNMGDVTDLLDINPRRPVKFEILEDSLYSLADEFSEGNNDYGYEDDGGDFDQDIDLFLEKYDDLDGSRNWRRLEKDLVGMTQLINGDQKLTMKDVGEMFDISFKQRIDLEKIEESLYELAEGFSSDDDDEDELDFEDDIDLDDETGNLFTEIDNFLDNYSELKSPFKWKAIDQKDIIDLTEYIVDEDLSMRDVTELLDINPKRPVKFEALEDSLYSLADEFSEEDELDFEDDIDLDDETGDLFTEIDNFLDDYSDLKSPFKWKAIDQKDIVDLTEYIVDEDLSMRDVTELLDINPKRPVKFEALEESLYDLADEFSEDDDFEDDIDLDGEADDLFAEIDDFLDDYSGLQPPFKWKAIDQKGIIDLTEYIVDEDLSMLDVTELLDVNPKRPIKFESLKESLYTLAYAAVDSEDDEFDYDYDDEDYFDGDYDYEYEYEDDFEFDDDDEYDDDFVDYYNDEEDDDFDDEEDYELENDYEYEYEGADVAFRTIDPITNYAKSRQANPNLNSFSEQVIEINDPMSSLNTRESVGDYFMESSNDPQVANLINEQIV